MTTATDLRAFIKAGAAVTDQQLTDALNVAGELLDDALAGAFKTVPDDVRHQLDLEVGAEVYRRRDGITGQSQYAQLDGLTPVAGPRDPLTRVRPIIGRYVVPF